jgi:hypothetical protein
LRKVALEKGAAGALCHLVSDMKISETQCWQALQAIQ